MGNNQKMKKKKLKPQFKMFQNLCWNCGRTLQG